MCLAVVPIPVKIIDGDVYVGERRVGKLSDINKERQQIETEFTLPNSKKTQR